MKKILFISAIACMAIACGNKAATEEAVAEDSVVVEEAAACCGKCCGEAATCCEDAKDKTLGEIVADKAVEAGAPEEVKEATAEVVDAAAAKAVEALKK